MKISTLTNRVGEARHRALPGKEPRIATGNKATITVLESVDAPGRTVKYIDQVVRDAPDDIAFRYFSWVTALLGQYDVLHVHWPEFLIRGRRQWIARSRRLLFRLLLTRLRLTGTRVVRTIHNLAPHSEGDRNETRLLKRLDNLTDAWVRINEVTPFPAYGDHYTVLHGSYREQFAAKEALTPVAGRILYIGRIEPYKGVEDLARAFAASPDLQAELRLVGSAPDGLRQEVARVAETDDRISCVFEFVSDEQLVAEIEQAEIIALPYREMHNSGIALIALSLDRPILVPDTDTNAALAREAGSQWVLRYSGEISGEILQSALCSVRRRGPGSPALGARDWSIVADGYAKAFRGERVGSE